jgi:hypothetical protein
MAFELEALVGHLYIFGGRTININPPGALVEIAPRSAARGREGDTFFALILPSGDVAPTSFYEQMAKLASERYFNVSGSVTSALRTMFQIINRNLYEHNQGGQQNYEASIVVGVLHDEDLYVGRVGSSLSILQTNGLTLTFPEDITNDETLFNVPLGVQPVPDVKMARYAINAGTRLLLSDVNLAEIPLEKLTHTLAASDIEQVLDGLQTTINVQAQLMVVEFVPPEEESTVLAAPGESSTEITTKLGEARVQVMQDEQRQRQTRGRGIEEGAKRRVGNAAGKTAKGLTIFSRLFERFLPPPDPEAERRISSGTITLAVLVIPIVIMAIVVVSWASDIGETDYEQCLGELLQTVDLAQSIDSGDRRGVMAAWNAALLLVNECEGLRPGDPTVQAMRTAAQDVMDTLNNIKRRPATPLASFENASITRIRLQGLDMYALDAANDLVYRIKINGEGNGVVLQEPIPNLRRGATVDGLTVGNIVDIAFDDLTGDVAIIDSAGVLVRCSPSFIMNCNAQRVLAVEQWQNPISLTIWSGRLYVLDSEGGQIWRYDPSGGTYASAPREYFAGDSRPNLRNVVDFTISLGGTVYLLYDDGVMKTYIGGDDRPFAFSGFNEGRELNVVTAQGFYLNDSPIDPAFFIISQPARTIFETTLAGTFIDSYQVFEEDKLALLSAIVAYPTQNILYVASGNTIFTLQKGD